MNTYQHITNRDEFIGKFRQDQGLRPIQNEVNKPKNETNRPSRIQSGNVSMNKSVMSNNHQEGRWDYLYQLEKLKQMKLDEQRRLKEQAEFDRDITECTFNPRLNSNKSMTHLKSRDNMFDLNGNYALMTNENQDEKTQDSLLNRQEQWSYKKSMKIERIKQNQNLADTKECVFKPKLNSPNKISKIDITEQTKNRVVDPESYLSYVNRLYKKREINDKDNYRLNSRPGTGNIWKNKVTKPQEIRLGPKTNLNKSLNIKSLNKPIAPAKFSNFTKRDTQSATRHNLNDRYSSSQREETKFEEYERKNKNDLKLEGKIEFNYALKNLHNQLHSIDLLSYEN